MSHLMLTACCPCGPPYPEARLRGTATGDSLGSVITRYRVLTSAALVARNDITDLDCRHVWHLLYRSVSCAQAVLQDPGRGPVPSVRSDALYETPRSPRPQAQAIR